MAGTEHEPERGRAVVYLAHLPTRPRRPQRLQPMSAAERQAWRRVIAERAARRERRVSGVSVEVGK